MSDGQFRFAFFTPEYQATITFLRDDLEFEIQCAWDRSPDDRGTLFHAASGLIEVLALPGDRKAEHVFDDRPAQGAFIVIEVDDLDARYKRVVEKGIALQQDLKSQSWGHRSFCVREPNGLTLYFFSR